MARVLLSFFFILLWGALAGAETQRATVVGRVSPPGESNVRGIAALWEAEKGAPDPRRFIAPPFAFDSLQADGSFSLEAPPGEYYLGALVRRTPGPATGPPREGDLVFMSPDPRGASLLVTLPEAGGSIDVGVHEDFWRYTGFDQHFDTGVAGKVTTLEGEPLPGLLVFAFPDAGMSGRPLGISGRTGADGSFRIRLRGGETVFLRVKESFVGGRPLEGEYMGVFGAGSPQPVTVEKGQVVSGIVIQALKVPPLPAGKGPPGAGERAPNPLLH